MEKITLGKVKTEIKESQSYNPKKDSLFIQGETIVIKKHSFDCGWYWGFGYIGNRNLHCHSSIFTNELLWHDAKDVFEKSIFENNKDFWIFKDLLAQAYALQKASEVYRHGGFITSGAITEIIKNKDKENAINKDLKKVLDTLWNFLESL